MPNAPVRELDLVKAALHRVAPTGPDGFEGLLATLLSAIAGHPFRLAGPASQFGKDGEAIFDAGAIAFEAKLYTGAINKADVLNKIAEIIAAPAIPDVWALGATTEVKTQISSPLQTIGERNGVFVLLLDWTKARSLPPLACVCAAAKAEFVEFFRMRAATPQWLVELELALETISTHPDFEAMARTVTDAVTAPTIGLAPAIAANRDWLRDAFSDPRRARRHFGQPIAPLAKMAMAPVERTDLQADLGGHLVARPRGQIVMLTGEDGCGKSWLFAQTWLSNDPCSITIFLAASEVSDHRNPGSLERLIIDKLLEQTDAVLTEANCERWRRRFSTWRDHDAERPRLLVFVDGLNEKPTVNWAQWLDGASVYLQEIGGLLLASVRETVFRRVRHSLLSRIDRITVVNWTAAELEAILRNRGIEPRDLEPRVKLSLRNPRVLAIAFELLHNEQVASARELSVPRLLYEHIRAGTQAGQSIMAPDAFRRALADHARTIFDRLREKEGDDRFVFDSANAGGATRLDITQELLPVTQERFFQSLAEDPTLYTLTDDGLVFALGIAIIRDLQTAERNDRAASEQLDQLLEPIAALDMTARIVFAAALVASVDDHCTASLQAALIGAYVRLQNIGSDTYPAFVGIVRHATEAALRALFTLDSNDDHVANKDWLVAALRSVRSDPKCWTVIAPHVERWLRLYSLAPEIGVMARSNEERWAEEVTKRKAGLNERVECLTSGEAAFLADRLERADQLANTELSRDAFALLAGMPLVPFAEPLVCWSFASALSATFRTPDDEFQFLIQFNQVDWQETRTALLRESALFRRPDASKTAKWATVGLLRAMSTADDAALAADLVETIIEDWQRGEGWRLIETYCATDPCDPGAVRPPNIDATARSYADIDAGKLAVGRWMGESEHFLEGALPGLSRFSPAAAVDTYRAYAADVAERSGETFRLGITWLQPHSAVIDDETARRLIERAYEQSAAKGDHWISSQFALLTALPHLDGDAQLGVLLDLPPRGPPLLQLQETFRPAAPASLESAIGRAVQTGEKNRLLAILAFAENSETPLTANALEAMQGLTSHPSSAVRGLAMGICADHASPDFLDRFAGSGWTAAALDAREHYFERWYGSALLVAAAAAGAVPEEELIGRISQDRLDLAFTALGPAAASAALHIDAALHRALEVELPFQPPRVQRNSDSRKNRGSQLLSLMDDEAELTLDEKFRRMSEADADFEARQERGWQAFHEFETALTREGARLIIDNIGQDVLGTCVAAMPETVESWAHELLALDDAKLRRVYNLGLRIARALATSDAGLACALFRHLEGKRGFVHQTFGLGSVPLEAIAVWACPPSPPFVEMWEDRLDRAQTDHAIAAEVLAALLAGRDDSLEAYARARLASDQPAILARGLMVCGLGRSTPFAEAALAQHRGTGGLIGRAATAAAYAYERDNWSRHWFSEMASASTREDFWRFSNLFLKIVDARFDLWEGDVARVGDSIRRFGSSLERPMEKRVKAWAKKRGETLLGSKVPRAIYLPGERRRDTRSG